MIYSEDVKFKRQISALDKIRTEVNSCSWILLVIMFCEIVRLWK